ncbi:MAG: carbamate kinase [Lachnospiraceae bacterium]|uniref:carbamate kinase n=1 Tax=Porcincola sp. LCP21S3_C12 TaxID=3438798 RepID=UPI00297164B6|nr:carbamate kinase [Lachnospiraceae bacterium]
MEKRVVAALGHHAVGTNFPEQYKAVHASVKVLADLIEAGCQLVITHSNAPQVGMIHTALNEYAKNHETYNAPMSLCSSMSQGLVGYDIQNMLHSELMDRGIYRTVSTVITQVIVDPYDEAFYHPVKVIGRILTKEEAQEEESKGNYVVEAEGGYRRIVASPKPIDIVEIDAVNALVQAGQIVIAGGGGGIPVLKQPHRLKSASAIVEKDLTAGKLADLTDADILLFLTGVDQVSLHYGSGHPEPLDHLSAAQARAYMADGEFGETGMQPKIEASVNFVSQKTGRKAIITSPEKALAALRGVAGTTIQ